MSRSWFGGTGADMTVAIGPSGALLARPHNVTFWSAQTGGTQYTDLLLNGVAVTSIPSGADGQIPRFQGPDAVPDMWMDAGGARLLMTAQRRISVGSSAPASPVVDDIWIDTT